MWNWFQSFGYGGGRSNRGPQPDSMWYWEKNSTYAGGQYVAMASFRIYDDKIAAMFKLSWC